jgi:ubiquinone/menaquinone biosynthesis C-methylase UbiE
LDRHEHERSEVVQQYAGKYEQTGRVGRILIDRFYSSLERLAALPEQPIRDVLEVGCGPGYSGIRIAAFHPQANLLCSDVEAELVYEAQRRNHSARFLHESAYALAHPDDAFDLVYCLEVLEHLEEPERALAELARVARHAVIISVPREPVWCALNMLRGKYWSALGNTPGHLQHWSTASLVRFAARYGTVVAVRTPLPWTQCLIDVHGR